MSGVVLPTDVSGSASQWQMVDWRYVTGRSELAAGGVATVELVQLPDDEMWLVDRMVAQCDSTTDTAVRVTVGTLLVDGSNTGNFDVSESPNGILVRSSTSLRAEWVGASAGAVADLTLQVRVLRRT